MNQQGPVPEMNAVEISEGQNERARGVRPERLKIRDEEHKRMPAAGE